MARSWSPKVRAQSVLLCALAALMICGACCADGLPNLSGKDKDVELVPGRYLVRLRSDALPDTKDKQVLREAALANKAAVCECSAKVQEKLRAAGVQFTKGFDMGIVFHGFSFSLPEGADENSVVAQLLAMEEVISVEPVGAVKMLDNAPPADSSLSDAWYDLAHRRSLTEGTGTNSTYKQGLFDVWYGFTQNRSLTEQTGVNWAREQGLTGAGIKIGMISTGIDLRHPALGSCYKTPGCKIVAGYDLVGDNYSAFNKTFQPPQPDNNPSDLLCPNNTQSSMTSTAGILVGAATLEMVPQPKIPFTGVAPGVQLGAYRVYGCPGSSSTDIIIAAIEQAYEDGMDLVYANFIIPNLNWPYFRDLQVYTDALEKLGMVLLVPAGQSGSAGIWGTGEPANSLSAVAVAASAPTTGQYITIELSDGTTFKPTTLTSLLAGHKPGQTYDGLQLWAPAAALANVSAAPFTGGMDGCSADSFKRSLVEGKIVLIATPGGDNCTIGTRIDNAARAGAAAVIVGEYPGRVIVPYVWESDMSVFVVGSGDFGNLLGKLVGAGGRLSVVSWDAWPLAATSSIGPDAEMRLTPMIAAPGQRIYTTNRIENSDVWVGIPTEQRGYASVQGSGQAATYMAGVLALYMEAKGLKANHSLDVKDLMAAFINTAEPIPNLSPGRPAASVLRAGAGEVRLDRAIQNQVRVTPDHVILKTKVTTQTVTIKLRNTGRVPVSFTLGHTPAMSYQTRNMYSRSGVILPKSSAETANVAFKVHGVPATRVVIAPNRDVVLEVTITAPDCLINDRWFYSGYITLTPKVGSPGVPLSIPYLGHTKELSSIPALAETEGLFAMGSGVFNKSKTGELFFSCAVQRPVKSLSIQVYDANTTAWLGTFSQELHVSTSPPGSPYKMFLNNFTYTQPSGALVPFQTDRRYYLGLDIVPSVAISDAAPVKLNASPYLKSMAAAVMQKYVFPEQTFTFTA